MNVSSIGSQNNASSSPTPASAEQRAAIQTVKAIDPQELFGEDSEFRYIFDRKLQEMIVRVIDQKTGDVKLQIPAEYLVQLAEEMKGG